MLTQGKRYQVFSIREAVEKNQAATWVRAGYAFVNRDGSVNVYLDVLPINGKLNIRESVEKKESTEATHAEAA